MCHPWFGLVWLGNPLSSVCYTFLHISTIMKHLDTFILASRRINLTFSSWHRVCMENRSSALSDNLTSSTTSKFRAKLNNKQIPCQAQQQANSVPSATIFTVYRKNGFPTNGNSFPVDNTGQNSVMQGKTCHSSNLVFLLLTMWAIVC